MSRKRHSKSPDTGPDSYPFSEQEPVSMRGTKFVDAQAFAIIASADARSKSCLPYVSWEKTLRTDEQCLALGISYPRTAPPDRPLISDRQALRSAVREAIQNFKRTGLPDRLGIRRTDLQKYFPVPKNTDKVNPALALIFFSWNVDDAPLFRAADVHVKQSIMGSLEHLIRPRKPRARFTQAGEGLVGVNPRLAAWRSWLDFQQGVAKRHDYFMDLRSFCWLTLQHDLLYDAFILGGTVVAEGDDGRILCALRTHKGWFVDEWREHQCSAPAVLLMS